MAKPPASKPVPTGPESPSAVVVRALRPGFRRGGRAWSVAGEIVDPRDFSEDQWSAILAEPLLSVSPAPLPDPDTDSAPAV